MSIFVGRKLWAWGRPFRVAGFFLSGMLCDGEYKNMEMGISLPRSLRSRNTVPNTPQRAPHWGPVLRLMPHHAPLVVPCRRSRHEPRARSSQVNPGRTLHAYRVGRFSRQTSSAEVGLLRYYGIGLDSPFTAEIIVSKDSEV